MKSHDFARAIVADLRSRRLSPTTIAEYARCIAIVHAGDHFDFQRYATKLLGRHARRPGRRRDPEKQQRVAQAAIQARFNAGDDKEAAAASAADFYGVSAKAVFRAAFERKDKPMRALIRQARKNSTGL
jgi:hypothetical protein